MGETQGRELGARFPPMAQVATVFPRIAVDAPAPASQARALVGATDSAVRRVAAPPPPKKPWTIEDPIAGEGKSVRIRGQFSDDLDIPSLCEDIADRIPGDQLARFAEAVGDTLDEYKALMDESPRSQGWASRRDAVVSEFLSVCEEFVEVDLVRIMTRRSLCPGCGLEMQRLDAVEANVVRGTPSECGVAHNTNMLYCSACNVEIVDRSPITNYGASSNRLGGVFLSGAGAGSGDGGEGSERAVVSDHSSYNDLDTFTRAWLAYHGRHNPKLPSNLFQLLDEYFTKQGMKTGAEYRASPLITNRYGERVKEGTSVERMRDALKALEMPLYIDEFYIRHVYWGWPLPDATAFQELVFKNYDRTQRVFPLVKEARKSSLNAWYRLYQELRAAGHECHPHTFNLVTTDKIRQWHDRVRSKMCELANRDGGVEIPFFPIG